MLIFFPILMMILINPKVLSKIFSVFLKNNENSFRSIFLFKIGILYLIAYIILGLSLYFCILAFVGVDLFNLPYLIAANAFSLVIGILAVFAPAGIGVTEGIISVIISHIIPFDAAVMVVVALRIVRILVDLSCALVSAGSVAATTGTK